MLHRPVEPASVFGSQRHGNGSTIPRRITPRRIPKLKEHRMPEGLALAYRLRARDVFASGADDDGGFDCGQPPFTSAKRIFQR